MNKNKKRFLALVSNEYIDFEERMQRIKNKVKIMDSQWEILVKYEKVLSEFQREILGKLWRAFVEINASPEVLNDIDSSCVSGILTLLFKDSHLTIYDKELIVLSLIDERKVNHTFLDINSDFEEIARRFLSDSAH